MRFMAAGEVVAVFSAIVLFIWRVQFVFPDFAWLILGFLILTFVLHGDSLARLGFGTHGFVPAIKALALPTAIIAGAVVVIGVGIGTIMVGTPRLENLGGLGRYFAWCLFQEFGLQSFFTNRVFEVIKNPKKAAWISGTIFAAFHIPNPVLMPLTLLGGIIFSRVFLNNRNLVPLALSQAIIGSLTSVAIPVAWHHSMRVGPGYYWWFGHSSM
jgi:hypothetical protein